MADTNIGFANIVPNTTPASWSQAYNAGKLFAVLSLEQNMPEGEGVPALELNVLGKEVISTFEQEFFTLENKNLDSIKQAIATSIEKIKDVPTYSFVITYVSGSVLYVFIAGSGSVYLKRGSKLGAILESDGKDSEIKSGSGFLQNDDLVILQTQNFSKIIGVSSLADSLDGNDPSSISESLAPKIHEKGDGAAAAVILIYKDDKAMETLSKVAPQMNPDQQNPEVLADIPNLEGAKPDNFEEISLDKLNEPETGASEKPVSETPSTPVEEKAQEPLPSPPLSELVLNAEEEPEDQGIVSVEKKRRIGLPRFSLGHRRRLLLSIAVVIIIVLAAAIFLGVKHNNDEKVKAQFQQIYPPAKSKFDEGKGLEELNPSLAQEDYTQAKNILAPNKDKFPQGSSEDKQIEDLLSQVNNALGNAQAANSANAKEVSSSSSDLLSVELNNPSVSYFAQDDKNVYFIDGSGIQEVSKSTQKKTQIVKKSWTDASGLGTFLGNLYLVDRGADQIYKFASATFAKSNYLGASSSASFSDSVAMAIDGSIYVLSSDGSVQKFLRGNSTTFSISGLTQPLLKPTRITTDGDFTDVYILDPGSSRIVVLDKTGKFVTEYSSNIIKNAKDFEVLEKDKKIYILSSGKVYQIDLK